MQSTINRTSRKEIERANRCGYVLTTTRELLAEREIDTVTMEDIALAAGYTRRTLYAYFSGRTEILLGILTQDLIDRWAFQKTVIAQHNSGLDQLVAWARSLYDYSVRHPQSVRLQAYFDFRGVDRAAIPAAAFEAFKTINDDLAEGLRAIFRLGIDDGSIRPELEIDLTISIFLHSLRACLHRAFSATYSFAAYSRDQFVTQFIDLFSRSIAIKPGRTP